MAKKKKTPTKKSAPSRAVEKSAKKTTKTPPRKTPTKSPKKAAAKTGAPKTSAAKSKASEPAIDDSLSLGRPIVTQEEKLYMLFKEDYHARQIFDFLRVETVKELEEFSPQEILKRLSEPIRQTVDRIRKKLAEKKRSLAGDEEFAHKHRPA
jgi:hypothetical protein